MKTKALISIIEKLAALSSTSGAQAMAASLTDVASQLRPYSKGEVAQLFLKDDASPSSHDVLAPSGIKMQVLGDMLRSVGELVGAAGSAAKAKELVAIGNAFAQSPASGFYEHVTLVEQARAAETKNAIAKAVEDLTSSQYELATFEKAVERISKLPVDVINSVAVGFVAGRPKYPSKAKALAAIRDKRYERAQLKAKMERG